MQCTERGKHLSLIFMLCSNIIFELKYFELTFMEIIFIIFYHFIIFL